MLQGYVAGLLVEGAAGFNRVRPQSVDWPDPGQLIKDMPLSLLWGSRRLRLFCYLVHRCLMRLIVY